MNTDYQDLAIIIISISILIIIICAIIFSIFNENPFHYPYFVKEFDVSGKRNVDIEDCIEEYLLNPRNWVLLKQHKKEIEEWKIKQKEKAEGYGFILRKTRIKQYNDSIDDEHAFCFITTRDHVRYKQRNYVKTSYTVTDDDNEMDVSWQWLINKNYELSKINYETTLKKYHAKNQRNLMTPELRKQILRRDNYTCQICGRYQPDGFGLQIDHIVPIAKGGKTVPSNLQVLCYECNSKKRTKIIAPSAVRKAYTTPGKSVKPSPVVFPKDPEEMNEENTEQIPVIFPDDPLEVSKRNTEEIPVVFPDDVDDF